MEGATEVSSGGAEGRKTEGERAMGLRRERRR